MLSQCDNEDLIKIKQGLRVGKVLTAVERREITWCFVGLSNRKERAFVCEHLNISETTKLPRC